jgi:hypothetical protein
MVMMKGDKVRPYETKAERLQYLCAVLEAISVAPSLELAQTLARDALPKDNRFKRPSPNGYAEILKAEQLEAERVAFLARIKRPID